MPEYSENVKEILDYFNNFQDIIVNETPCENKRKENNEKNEKVKNEEKE